MSLDLAAEELYVYTAIALLALCSVITRAGYQVFGDYLPLSDGVRRALRYAPAAALTAIVVPDLLPWKAGLGPQLDMKLLAGVVGIVVFLRTRSAVAVIVTGMLVLWGLRWLAP
jgi:branched-subunit amino acid transport protein